MAFYDLSKAERAALSAKIKYELLSEIKSNTTEKFLIYFSDEDTYIRKAAYTAIYHIVKENKNFVPIIVLLLEKLYADMEPKVRQTTINAAGEIAKKNFEAVEDLLHKGLRDEHHSVRNAVIGSMKKAGERNPKPVLHFAQQYLTHPDKEIRREICHGIELRGRTHPQDILPFLRQLQWDKTARVRNTLVHVLGQIAYKKGCLATVITHLKTWENKPLVADAVEEIIDVHHRYRNFSILTQEEARKYIAAEIGER